MKKRKSEQRRIVGEALKACSDGHPSEALLIIEPALELSPLSPVTLVVEASIYRALKRYPEAEHAVRRALGIDSQSEHAWNELGCQLREREMYEDSAKCYVESGMINPNKSVFTVAAKVYLKCDPRKALEYADKALELDSEWDEALAVRELASRKIGEI